LKSRRKLLLAACAALAVAARGELADYIQRLEIADRLQGVFFHSATLPAGPVLVRRPPTETRQALGLMISASPGDAQLYALRAQEAELALDFGAADADWKKHAELAKDQPAARLALADFYHRRLRWGDEIDALRTAGAFERGIAVAAAHALPAAVTTSLYRAWMAHSPGEPEVYRRFLEYLTAQRDWPAAEKLLTEYAQAFPADQTYPVRARAALERRRGSPDRAIAVYDQAFRPLWPAELAKEHIALLGQSRGLRKYFERVRAQAAANPLDLAPAARLFYFHQQQANLAAAQRALADFRQRKEARKAAWTAGELLALGRLYEAVHNYDEAARCYHALYSLPGATPAVTEDALASLANLLLSAPEQPVRFGAGDLSFYKDIATVDDGPGFLNGVLSLILNSTSPEFRYQQQQRGAAAYYHRARGAELVALVDSRFPQSARRAGLHAKLIEAYATYGESDAVIAAARRYLADFPAAPERVRAALAMADAFARKKSEKEEFAVYESLLDELGKRANGVPLGEKATLPHGLKAVPPGEVEAEPEDEPPLRRGRMAAIEQTAHSPEYARVLDRYVARLASLKRVKEALALYRRQIDRNPNDPGLYERLAAFLEQNKLAAEVEQVYRRAMGQFPDRTWHHKLARWYLRRKQTGEFAALTRDVAKVFAGADLERYFREVVEPASLDAALYRQVNLYAHGRFPHNLAFVRNLLSAYTRPGTADPAAWEQLVRNYWFYDAGLRARFFEFLSRTNRLQAELQAARAQSATEVVARFAGEAEVWLCHFEAAEPRLRTLAEACPGCQETATRAAALERSLGNPEAASAIEQKLSQYDPRDTAALARLGELHADREDFARARPWWTRIAEIEPGKPDGYLESATVFWDYFLYDDALAQLRRGRERLAQPELYAYEAGAIHENKREYARAIEEYARGAAVAGGESRERARLIALARRPAHKDQIESLTAKLAAGADPDPGAVNLRVALLEAQNRRDDLERYLAALADSAATIEGAARAGEIAEGRGFTRVQERALARQVVLATDAGDRIRARLALIRFQESNGGLGPARQGMDALYREHPLSRGVVRAAVDFHWRNKETGRAVEILEEAARSAYPELSRQFTLEVARKATEAADYRKAFALAAQLLALEPNGPEYVTAMADVYARQGDDKGLRDFYTARLQSMRDAEQIAALRRGLIPVLTRMKDYSAALAQYIELLNRYPDDDGLTREAAACATAHNLRPRLLEHYVKAAAASPRDARPPLILARIQTHFEDLAAAIAAYQKASAIRPERTDLLEARAGLEARLMRFNDAAGTYAKLYELAYRNPLWMKRAAEMRAREGKPAEAVAALRQALIEGKPARAAAFFEVAQSLESWDMLTQAREFAEKGVELCAPDELAGAAVYARVMARLRQYETAFRRLSGNGEPALREVATVVRGHYTPEEKAAFGAFLEKQKTPERLPWLIDLAQLAGLAEMEARWRHERLLAQAGDSGAEMGLLRLISLQRLRGRFNELGEQLEAYWSVHPVKEQRDHVLESAAEAYRSAGNTQGEMGALSRMGTLSPKWRERYFTLLKIHQPQTLIDRAARDESAANFAVNSGDAAFALRGIQSRGRSRAPVWTRAYTALVGLHYSRATPQIRSAFAAALGGGAVGERIGKPVDRREQLAGDLWFYYGSRHGEYLSIAGEPDAEDYLPAMLEATPGRAEAYFTLAEFYREKGDRERALGDYERAIELDRGRADAHNRVATLLSEQGRTAEAVARWKLALDALAAQQDLRRPPPTFWEDTRAVIENAGRRGAFAPLRGEIDRLLRTYVRRNGPYRVHALLEAAVAAAGAGAPSGPAGVEWVVDLAGSAPDPLAFLEAVVESAWVGDAERDVLLRRLVALASARPSPENAHRRWQVSLIEHLVSTRRFGEAQQILAAISPEERKSRSYEIPRLEALVAARSGKLDALLERLRREPEAAQLADQLLGIAYNLRRDGDRATAGRLVEFVRSREIDAGDRAGATFLGLAEALLEQGEAARAVAVLRRMTVLADEPFSNLEAAAALLSKYKRPVEAREFLEADLKASPWKAAARRAAAMPKPEAVDAEALAADPERPGLRLALFRAALDAGEARLAVSTIEPTWERGGLKHMLERDPVAAEEQTERGFSPYEFHASQFLAGTELSSLERATLARRLAGAFEKLDQPPAALVFYLISQEIAATAEARAAIARLRADFARRAENERRRPIVRDLLDQPLLVRPRLTAGKTGEAR